MQIMYSYIEPWVIDQNVYIMSDGIHAVLLEKIPLENLVEYLNIKYRENKCDKLILHGSNYAYTNQIGEDIINYSLNNYGKNDINLEVIKE